MVYGYRSMLRRAGRRHYYLRSLRAGKPAYKDKSGSKLWRYKLRRLYSKGKELVWPSYYPRRRGRPYKKRSTYSNIMRIGQMGYKTFRAYKAMRGMYRSWKGLRNPEIKYIIEDELRISTLAEDNPQLNFDDWLHYDSSTGSAVNFRMVPINQIWRGVERNARVGASIRFLRFRLDFNIDYADTTRTGIQGPFKDEFYLVNDLNPNDPDQKWMTLNETDAGPPATSCLEELFVDPAAYRLRRPNWWHNRDESKTGQGRFKILATKKIYSRPSEQQFANGAGYISSQHPSYRRMKSFHWDLPLDIRQQYAYDQSTGYIATHEKNTLWLLWRSEWNNPNTYDVPAITDLRMTLYWVDD